MTNEILSELHSMLDDIGDMKRPNKEDGWYTVEDVLEEAQGLSKTQVRTRLNKLVASGKYERVAFGQYVYYRKVV